MQVDQEGILKVKVIIMDMVPHMGMDLLLAFRQINTHLIILTEVAEVVTVGMIEEVGTEEGLQESMKNSRNPLLVRTIMLYVIYCGTTCN